MNEKKTHKKKLFETFKIGLIFMQKMALLLFNKFMAVQKTY